ncbi:MAG: tetratricopeptide repeat protein [Cyanobacteria bacterium J06592_8]
MNSHHHFYLQGYEIIRELGRNREGGRITWLASTVETQQQVVLKQFCFAQSGSDWSAFHAYENEIKTLQGLAHPGIPSYLGAFETPEGFCMVQEYIDALSLGVSRSFSSEEVKQIAISALEILVYLQNRIPPIIHRDIKPENLLVDSELKVYLIDFGFARIGSQEVSASSVFKGTPGFIPPEQLRRPTEASDLYGLGATLICLLTAIPSTAIQDLTDDDDPYVIQFKHLVPRLSLKWIAWLEKMVKPRLKERYSDAETALNALEAIYISRVPEAKLSSDILRFQATQLGERLTQTVSINNPVPETLLEGYWEVAPHLQDPPHTPNSHAWISFSPPQFKGNFAQSQVQIDTSKLAADQYYERELLLHTNTLPDTYHLKITVKTAPLPVKIQLLPYKKISWWLVFSAATTAFYSGMLGIVQLSGIELIIVFGMYILLLLILLASCKVKVTEAAAWWGFVGAIAIFGAGLSVVSHQLWSGGLVLLIGWLIGGGIGGVIFFALLVILANLISPWLPSQFLLEKEYRSDRITLIAYLLSILLGGVIGIGLVTSLVNPPILLSIAGLSVFLTGTLLYSVVKYRQLIAPAYNNLGNALYDQGKLEEAIASYKKAIEINPECADAYNSLGLALRQQGQLEEAIASYKKAIEINPKYTYAYNNLGLALRQQGQLEEAIENYKKAIEINPEYTYAYNNLGVVVLKQKSSPNKA